MDNFKPCPFCGGEDVKVIAALDEEHCVDCWLEDLPSYGGKSSNYCVVCLKCQGNSGYRRTPQEAVDNWNRRADRWVPVEERLPEDGTLVLGCDDYGRIDVFQYDGAMYQPMWDECVTHWMPMPEPPESGLEARP